MNDAVHWNDTGTPLPMMHKPGDFVKEVVGARISRDWGKPLHICEMLRRHHVGTQENVVSYLTGDLKNNSDLCNLVTCIPVSCTDTMMLPKLTTNSIALIFTADKYSVKSGWN